MQVLCSFRLSVLIIAAEILGVAVPAYASERIDKLIRAYPDFLTGQDGTHLIWKDGTKMPISDGRPEKSFDERLRSASIADQILLPYPKGPLPAPPRPNSDPGRFRNSGFFDKMYGDCTKNEAQSKLVLIDWVPHLGGGRIQVTKVNNVHRHLKAISDELEKMPAMKRYLVPSAGTFNCRVVADTGQRSMHAWGAAIDINVRYSDYWHWRKGKSYVNRIPYEIVAVFERHGFIWGGKWDHYDTMHFEYRPELL